MFAGLELLRQHRFGGTSFEERIAKLRGHVVFTTHTPVPAGNEEHPLDLMRKQSADLGFTDDELTMIGGDPFSMTVAGLRLSRIANGVAELHGETARQMWKDVAGAAPIISITNGVHAPTWQDARIRAALVHDKPRDRQDAELWAAHQQMKAELVAEVAKRTGTYLDADKLLMGFARRAAAYKRADLILHDEKHLKKLFDHGVQLVYAGKAHPRDTAGKALVKKIVDAAKKHIGHVVFVENYDMRVGALLTRGVDVWLNNPRRPLEASGTSGMKAAMNGVPNLSILDGWWPEGCEHGVTGWKMAARSQRQRVRRQGQRPRRQARPRLALPGAREGSAAGVRRARQVAGNHAREHRDVAVAVLVGSDGRGLCREGVRRGRLKPNKEQGTRNGERGIEP